MDFKSWIATISELRVLANNFIENELGKRDIKDILPVHGSIFVPLFQNPEGLAIKSLVNESKKAKSTITKSLQSLEKNGYLTRFKNSKDSRSFIVKLTKKGWSLKPIFDDISLQLYQLSSQGLSKEEQNVCMEILSKIKDNFNVNNGKER